MGGYIKECVPAKWNVQNKSWDYGTIDNWGKMWNCTDPNSWAYFGIIIALAFSILGASA
jgi:hypothetical protein